MLPVAKSVIRATLFEALQSTYLTSTGIAALLQSLDDESVSKSNAIDNVAIGSLNITQTVAALIRYFGAQDSSTEAKLALMIEETTKNGNR
jgi:hypothetical protein